MKHLGWPLVGKAREPNASVLDDQMALLGIEARPHIGICEEFLALGAIENSRTHDLTGFNKSFGGPRFQKDGEILLAYGIKDAEEASLNREQSPCRIAKGGRLVETGPY